MGVQPASPQRPLHVGLIVPAFEGEWAGATPRGSDILEFARLAEEVGFDSLWIPDHLLFREDGVASGVWEGWSLLTAIAAVTTRVEIGTYVICTSFRNPALLAKMADTVEEISGGRLILGLGAGYHEPEYTAFGYPFDHRVSRFAEALAIIHGLLRTGHVDFEGTYYQARDCELRPRGPRLQGPPIMIGSTAPRMLQLLATYGDIWTTWIEDTANRPEGIAPLRETVDAACAAAGRDPATVVRTAAVLVKLPGGPDRFEVPPLVGSPAELAEHLRAFGRAGITHLQVVLLPSSPAGITAFAPVLEVLDHG